MILSWSIEKSAMCKSYINGSYVCSFVCHELSTCRGCKSEFMCIVFFCSTFSKEIEKCFEEPQRLGLIFSRYVSKYDHV